MEIGLFFGSFNPVHVGHLILADHFALEGGLDRVWFVVSPQNPFKKERDLAGEFDRLDMVRQAVYDNPRLEASDVEMKLERPSYTAVTMAKLTELYPQHRFSLIMGGDNLTGLERWKNYEYLTANFPILVYPRPGTDLVPALARFPMARAVEAPLLQISASMIRRRLAARLPVDYLIPTEVERIVRSRHLYGS